MNKSYIMFILYQYNIRELFILIHNNKSSLLSVASCNWWQTFPRVEAPLDMVPWGDGSLPLSSFQKNNIRLLYLIKDTQKLIKLVKMLCYKLHVLALFELAKINTVGQNIPTHPLLASSKSYPWSHANTPLMARNSQIIIWCKISVKTFCIYAKLFYLKIYIYFHYFQTLSYE